MLLADYTTADAARLAILDLDRVKTRKLYYFETYPDGEQKLCEMNGFLGLLNATKHRPITPITPRYAVMQHEDVFATALAVIADTGLEERAAVFVENEGDLARLWILFQSQREGPYLLGYRLTSSQDRSVSLSNHLLIWWHSVGAPAILSGPKSLGLDLALPHRSAAFDALPDRLREITVTVNGMAAEEYAQTMILRAGIEPLSLRTTEEREELLTGILKSDKHVRAVLETMPDRPTKWDVYMAIMQYVNSHPISLIIRDRITEAAEAWLRS